MTTCTQSNNSNNKKHWQGQRPTTTTNDDDDIGTATDATITNSSAIGTAAGSITVSA